MTIQHNQPVSTVQGLLLLDPTSPPTPGWLRVQGESIESVHLGEPPASVPTPDVGSARHLICPAFVDAHFHIPQIGSIGCDGLELLEWLDTVIFPAEQWWGRGRAVIDAATAARRLIRQGTSAGAAFLSSHAEGSFDALNFFASQTRFTLIAGQAAMDRNAPEPLTLEDRTRRDAASNTPPALPHPDAPHVRSSINPRFAISCTPELLAECGWYAQDNPERFVQTHLAENLQECRTTAELFPDAPTYTDVYDQAKLLGPRTLLAHCIHLSDDEWARIVERQSITVHCPGANIFLSSGRFDLDKARAFQARVALGTDIAAGPDAAMPRVARAMIETAKHRALSAPDPAPWIPSPADAWDMITRGNAGALALETHGKLEAGARADILALKVPETWFDEHLVGRIIYNWSGRLIDSRIIGGHITDPESITATP